MLLGLRHARIGIGGIAHAGADAAEPGLDVGGEEQSPQREFRRFCRFGDGGSLLRARKYGIDDHRMAGGHDTRRLVGQRRIDAGGDLSV